MSLYGSFEIGKKALAASQLGQSITGHNIANVNTEGFSRQEVTLKTSRPGSDGKSTGVDITGIQRKHDGFTKQKVVEEQTQVGTWKTKENILTEAEIIYTDLEGTRLRNSMDEFWGAWNSVATEPESVTHRKSLLIRGQELAQDFRAFNKRLIDFKTSINSRITAEIEDINQTTREIGLLNKQVEQLEKRGLQANDARDQREVLLQKLSDKIELRSFENPNGNMEVQIINGQHLVHGRQSYPLVATKVVEGKGNIKIGLSDSSGVQTDITDTVKFGGLKEMINQRDINIKQYEEDLDLMVNELAFRVNGFHSSGTGIRATRTEEISAYSMDDEARTYPVPDLKSGTFEIKLLNPEQEFLETITVDIQAGADTLETIIEKINRAADAYEMVNDGDTEKEVLKEVNKLKAQINDDGTVSIKSGMGNQFVYGKDNTNILTVLGFNCFFHLEEGAHDIRVNQELVEDEMKIAAGSDLVPGDNQIAAAIADLQFGPTMQDDTVSFDEFYNAQITDIGLKVQNAQKGNISHNQMLEQYEALRDSVSSVNLDEEMTRMIKYQRAYESTAKFLSTVDQMTQTVINM